MVMRYKRCQHSFFPEVSLPYTAASGRLQFLSISKHDPPSEYLSKFLRNPPFLNLLANPWGPQAPPILRPVFLHCLMPRFLHCLGSHSLGRVSKARGGNFGTQNLQGHHVKITLQTANNKTSPAAVSKKVALLPSHRLQST